MLVGLCVLTGGALADGDVRLPAAKIRFDTTGLDRAGLYGPADGPRALSYEFCIPDSPETLAEVRALDTSVQVARARGRIGCVDGELLCVGHTHQPEHRAVLEALARLPYVAGIEQTFFE